MGRTCSVGLWSRRGHSPIPVNSAALRVRAARLEERTSVLSPQPMSLTLEPRPIPMSSKLRGLYRCAHSDEFTLRR